MTMTFDAPGRGFAQFFGQSERGRSKSARRCEGPPRNGPSERKVLQFNDLPSSLLTKVIEGEIIPRLLMMHRDMGGAANLATSSEVFTQLVLAGDSEEMLLHVRLLVERGVPKDRIFMDVLAPVARRLGEMWVEDTCSFADVTLGLSRLHRVLHEVGRLAPPTDRGERYQAFFAPVPGEQHTFGISMLEEMFQHAGWDTESEYNPSFASIAQIAASKRLDVIGFSVGCQELLALLPDLIVETRKSSLNRDVTIMVGGQLFLENPDLASRFEDAVVMSDGVQAVQVAEQIVSRARGLERAQIV